MTTSDRSPNFEPGTWPINGVPVVIAENPTKLRIFPVKGWFDRFRWQGGLRGFPAISREELFRYFTLTAADTAFVAPRGRRAADRLGMAVVLCTLPWLGFVPEKLASAPPVAVARLAELLDVEAAEIRAYGRRAQTRSDHVRLVAQYLGWRPAGSMEMKELDEFLMARAMEHDSPTLLFRLGCEYLISARVIRPGPVTLVERVAHARQQAQEETYDRLAHEFSPQRCAELDALLVTDPSIRMSRLRWLSTGPVEASAVAVKAEVGLTVPDRGRLHPDVWQAWRDAHS